MAVYFVIHQIIVIHVLQEIIIRVGLEIVHVILAHKAVIHVFLTLIAQIAYLVFI